MSFLLPAILFATAVLSESLPARIKGDTYTDDKTGFSISKINGWEFSKDKKSYGLQLKDGSILGGGGATLATISRAMGDKFTGVPPTVGVKYLDKVKPDMDLAKWMEEEMKKQSYHDKYFVPASSPVTTTIDGKKGARVAYVNGTVIKGQEMRVYHVLYAVPAGNKVYLVHMNCSEGLSSEYLEDFSKIAGTIRTDFTM